LALRDRTNASGTGGGRQTQGTLQSQIARLPHIAIADGRLSLNHDFLRPNPGTQ
jgi:hypothetical protein